MPRGMLMIETPGSLARVDWIVVSALAGSPASSIPSSSEAHGSELRTYPIDAEGEGVIASDEAMDLEEASAAVELQIAHALGPLKKNFEFRKWGNDRWMFFSKLKLWCTATDSEMAEAVDYVRSTWIRLLWIRIRAKIFAARKKSELGKAIKSARKIVNHRMGLDIWPGTPFVGQEMNKFLDSVLNKTRELSPEESRWWHDLEEELMYRWWIDFVETYPSTTPRKFCDRPFRPRREDFLNYIYAKLRDRCVTNPSADFPVVIQVGKPLSLFKDEELKVGHTIRYADVPMDPNEEWASISDESPPGVNRRTLVFPTRKVGAALNIFFSASDTAFENLPRYVPMEVWQMNDLDPRPSSPPGTRTTVLHGSPWMILKA